MHHVMKLTHLHNRKEPTSFQLVSCFIEPLSHTILELETRLEPETNNPINQ